MKKLLGIVVLCLLLINPSQADDIKEFQIEGMSIGDSLLDFFSRKKIKDEDKLFHPSSKTFYSITLLDGEREYEIYEAVSFSLKNDDKSYKIYQLKGSMLFDNKLNECFKKKDEIVKEISNISKNLKEKNYTNDFRGKAGKSIAYVTDFKLSGGLTRVWCTSWDESVKKEKGWGDTLNVDISSQEYMNWLNNEAYK